jgi:putative endonuclease
MGGHRVRILATRKDGPRRVRVASDLSRRLEQHRPPSSRSFAARCDVRRLVHVEAYDDPSSAIRREKRPKTWPRAWKVAPFDANHPERLDRSAEFLGQVAPMARSSRAKTIDRDRPPPARSRRSRPRQRRTPQRPIHHINIFIV